MTDTLEQIRKASSSRWLWLLWLWKSRSVVQQLLAAIDDAPMKEAITRDRIHNLEVELAVSKEQSARVEALEKSTEKAVAEKMEALGEAQKATLEFDSLRSRCDRLQEDFEAARQEKLTADGELSVKMAELTSSANRIAQLEKTKDENTKALVHLIRWIQTTHRMQETPDVLSIKKFLSNAQQSHMPR